MNKTRAAGSAGERLIRILKTVVHADAPIPLPDITTAVNFPKPTVHRLVGLLENEGMVARDADGRSYVPGPALREITYKVLQNQVHRAPRHSILESVAGAAQEACNLAMLDGNAIVYLDRVDAAWPLSIHFEVGSRVPIHCTATGKLLLALQPKRVRDRLLAAINLEAMTPHTITNREALDAELERIRKERIGTDNQEFIEGMIAVAVPIAAPTGAPVAAVSIHAPIFRQSSEALSAHVPRLRAAAEELARFIYE